ncbi:MAG: alpha/beta hydrolase-fold protein [Oscillospiraceae bacterium]|nr:alpha/beta hydrolase-fold protein [Oscillospiraceae bacterium]
MFFDLDGKRCWGRRIGAAERGAPLILLLAGEYSRETEELTARLLSLTEAGALPAFVLAGADPRDWDADYSPWPVLTPGGRSFPGGAEETGQFYRERLLPRLREEFPCGEDVFPVGYSLGGLAALYLFCRGGFAGCGSCSGSLWYPGWTDYLREHPAPGRVYLSLGGRERNTKDPLMGRVEEETFATKKILEATARVVWVKEPGGHFRDIPGRLARAVAWLLGPEQGRGPGPLG